MRIFIKRSHCVEFRHSRFLLDRSTFPASLLNLHALLREPPRHSVLASCRGLALGPSSGPAALHRQGPDRALPPRPGFRPPNCPAAPGTRPHACKRNRGRLSQPIVRFNNLLNQFLIIQFDRTNELLSEVLGGGPPGNAS
jgi:hypothetical protein